MSADNISAELAPALTPMIPGCTPHRYYQVPEGLKQARRKQKVGIIFGYVGECYCGLQWNHLPEYPTVEEALMKALFETDMVSEVNFANVKVQQLLNFERASRTDKGVHALRNVISVAVMLPYDPAYVEKHKASTSADPSATNPAAVCTTPPPTEGGEGEEGNEGEIGVQSAFSCEEAKRLLNVALPRDIHVYAVVPVTRSFNAYLNCGGRRYEYYLPTFALMPQAAYTKTYFPQSLAPAQPTLHEVGFVPGKFGKHGGSAQTRMAMPLTEEEEETRKRKKKLSARKSKGHFPKRKRARVAARAATAAEATEAAEKEKASTAVPITESTVAQELSQGNTALDSVPAQVPAPSGPSETAPAEETQKEESESEDSDAEVQAVLARVKDNESVADNVATHFHDGLFETMILFRTIPTEAMQRAADYRLPAEQLEHVRRLFHGYEGTHCYHNFTPGGRSYDASCHRFMRDVTVSDPFIVTPNDAELHQSINNWSLNHFYCPDERVTATYEEWLREAGVAEGLHEDQKDEEESATNASGHRHVSAAVDAALRDRMRSHLKDVYRHGVEVVRIELDGQSFMLNQIRKMIGAVVCVTAAGLPDDYIREVLLRKGIRRGIPMAPANGLFLSFLDFSGYNRRLERIQNNGNNGTGKGALDVEGSEVKPEEVEEHRRRIIAVVLRNEMADDIMGKWMRSLRHVVRLAWRHDIP